MQYLPSRLLHLLLCFSFLNIHAQTVSFTSSALSGETLTNPTSLQFGPDGRLYVSQQNGLILAYSITRNGANSYAVTATETINLIQQIPNHNDDGSNNPAVTARQVTGIVVAGTAANPVIYVTSSDPRIGGNSAGTDTNLDTNSGVISRLTKNGNSWTRVDLVRGLPRSEENHSPNGLYYDAASNSLYMAQGGNTNMGAPSNNFALTPEYAYSTAILKINLTAIGNTTYDLPTLDDENRSNIGGAQAGYADANDPFGGNDGKNQGMLVAGGPVQIYSTGWRNNYDVIITQAGRMYSFDNGPNSGWGGPPANCANTVSEPGSADCDELHIVTEGYFAGHANPTRGSRSNTFNASNPQSPVPAGMENPIECIYQESDDRPGAITSVCSSTNGICEYTASNFNNALKGNLLAAAFNGNIYRLQFTAGGNALIAGGKTTLASGLGTTPLDIVAQGDNAPFPGTVWICTYGSHNISILEPNDFVVCSGDFTSFVLDFDNDGFSNGDETANATDPCSAASKPSDFDNDHISDLTDNDDDNDGINDQTDRFALDAFNGTNTAIPLQYKFDNSVQGGILGWGFTGLMTNGGIDYSQLFDEDAMTVGGAAYKFTVEQVPAGDALDNSNTQMYGFQFGVNTGTNQNIVVQSRVIGPFAGFTPANNQSMGLFIGTGDEDNYLKIVTAANGGAGGIQILKEENATSSATMYGISILNKSYVDLFFYINKATSQVQPKYSIEGGAEITLGAPITIPASWLNSVFAAGFISTSSGSGQPFPATWDLIQVTGDASPPCTANEVASFTLMKSGTGGEIGPLTDGMTINKAVTGSFSIRANTCNGQNVGSVKFIVNGSSVRTESSAPYSINGDNNGNYTAWNPATGTKTLTAVPYTGRGGTGAAGVSETVTFSVINETAGTPDCNGVIGGTATVDDCGVCSGGNTGHVANSDKDACGVCFGNGSSCGGGCQPLQITSLTLMREGTGGAIGTITEGMTIYTGFTGNFSIRADVCTGSTAVKSVKFVLNGSTFRVESTAPFALNGDSPAGNFKKWNPAPGSYVLTAIPYSGNNATGTPGIALTRTFTVASGTAKTEIDNSAPSDMSFKIYPNPCNGIFTLEWSAAESADLSIRVYNQTGALIYSDEKQGFVREPKEQISLVNQVTGIYFLQLKTGNEITNGKVLIWR